MSTKKVSPLDRAIQTVFRDVRRGERVLLVAAANQTPVELRRALMPVLSDNDLDRIATSPHRTAEEVDAIRRSGRFDVVVTCDAS